MRLLLRLLGTIAFCVLLFSVWDIQGSEAPVLLASATEPNYQLLTNPGMEQFDASYGQFSGVNCQVASGWQRFWHDGPEPCWMDTRVFAASHLGGGWVERIEGTTSQMIVSTEPYAAGLWQKVGGLTPGVGYGFHAALLTIFQTSAGDPDHGTMIKQVGIDPTGGTDPRASTIVWSEADGHDLGPWSLELRTAIWAEAGTATVFIRVISPHSAGNWPFMNLSFLDSAILAQTPSISASSPDVTLSPTFEVRWDNATAAPGAKRLLRYDVQWMDEADGIWHDWLTGIDLSQVQAAFTGQRGHTYRFRARVWQEYSNRARLVSPYRPEGDTRTFVQGARVVGQVRSNEGDPVVGATVAISGTQYAAVSGGDGTYEIRPAPSAEERTLTVKDPAWLAPAPVHGLVLGPTDTITVDWSLRPRDDAVPNGGFEDGLDGWSIAGGPDATPTLVAEPVHTGLGAVALAGEAGSGGTAILSQTVSLAGSWEPAMAFWYRPASTDPAGDAFRVLLTVEAEMSSDVAAPGAGSGAQAGFDAQERQSEVRTYVISPTLDVAGWQHVSLGTGWEEYITGTATIQFQVWNDGDALATTVTLDEVSLGKTPGGPYKSYLPVTLRSH